MTIKKRLQGFLFRMFNKIAENKILDKIVDKTFLLIQNGKKRT
jgi:hypothetical protein